MLDRDISIVIPTRNRASLLAKTLPSYANQTYPSEFFEIIVVDNASEDNTANVVNALATSSKVRIKYMEERNIGLHHARHSGAKAANSELILYGEDDIVASEKLVEEMMSCFSDNKIAAVGGRIDALWEIEPPSWLIDFVGTQYLGLLNLGEGVFQLSDKQYVCGGNFCIRKKILFDVKGFNPDGFSRDKMHLRGDGEIGLLKKMHKKNYRILYNNNAFVQHMISEERISLPYVKKRFSNEGISASFTAARKYGGSRLCILSDAVITMFRLIFYQTQKTLIGGPRRIKSEVFSHYLWSRFKHDFRIIADSNLRGHVVKNNFLDN